MRQYPMINNPLDLVVVVQKRFTKALQTKLQYNISSYNDRIFRKFS